MVVLRGFKQQKSGRATEDSVREEETQEQARDGLAFLFRSGLH